MRKPLNVTQVAAKWACSGMQVRRLINLGQLKAFKIGERNYRIWPEEVERFEKCGWSYTEESGVPTSQEGEDYPYVPPTVQKQSGGLQT